jgi:hypothetical protein
MSDADASASLKRWGELLVQIAKTRQRHIPIIQKVIPPHKAALFFNVDRRLYSLLELQVVSEMPLLNPVMAGTNVVCSGRVWFKPQSGLKGRISNVVSKNQADGLARLR